MRGISAPFRVAGRFLGVSAEKSKEYKRCAELWTSFAEKVALISRFFKSRKPQTDESLKSCSHVTCFQIQEAADR